MSRRPPAASRQPSSDAARFRNKKRRSHQEAPWPPFPPGRLAAELR